jgi:endonuclease YncB( thermonuclease family)
MAGGKDVGEILIAEGLAVPFKCALRRALRRLDRNDVCGRTDATFLPN